MPWIICRDLEREPHMVLEFNIKQHLYCMLFLLNSCYYWNMTCSTVWHWGISGKGWGLAHAGGRKQYSCSSLPCSGLVHRRQQALLGECCHRALELRQPSPTENLSPYPWCSAASPFISQWRRQKFCPLPGAQRKERIFFPSLPCRQADRRHMDKVCNKEDR